MPTNPPIINFVPLGSNGKPQDLLERVENYSPGMAVWSKREVSDVLVYDVADAKWGDFLMFMLGTEGVNPSSKLLYRTPPFGHPKYSYLYAQRVSEAQGVQFTGRDDLAGQGGIQQGLTNTPSSVAKYRHTRAHVEFGQPPRRIATDAQVVGAVDIWDNSSRDPPWPKKTVTTQREWLRNCDWFGWEPYGDFISLEGSTVSYAEGAGAGPSATSIPSPIGFPISKASKRIVWYDVPADYLNYYNTTDVAGDSQAGIPVNILAGINKVNAYDWFGFPAGTLLADPPKLTPHVSPIDAGPFPQILYDVEFNFRYLAPAYEIAGSSNPRGHQTLPVGRSGKWAFVTRDIPGGVKGSPTNPPLYQSYPFPYFFLPPNFPTFLNPYTKWNS